MTAPRILLFAGSTRKGSFNRRLADLAETCVTAAKAVSAAVSVRRIRGPKLNGK